MQELPRQTARHLGVDARAPPHRHLRHHFAVPEHPAQPFGVGRVVGVEFHRDALPVERHGRGHRLDQGGHAFAGLGRDAEAAGITPLDRLTLARGHLIDLVVDLEARHRERVDALEHAHHRGNHAFALGMRGVDHVHDQIGFGRLFERGAEGRHQRVRQPVDEADRVGDQHLALVGQAHAAHQRIERDEEGVRRQRVGVREAVEKRGLAGVGVAHERHGGHERLVTALTQLAAPLPHLIDVVADDLEARADLAAIHFELGLARALAADTAAEARQGAAGADQPR